jgi:cholesterol transport system auxiliary component
MIRRIMNTSRRRGTFRAFALSFACASLIGCALGGRPAAPVATFVLQGADTQSNAPNAATDLVLKVSVPDAAPAFESSRMAYIEQPFRIDYFAQNEWADPPSRMLKTLLMQQLSNCGLFRFVFTDSAGVDESLRLDSELIELVQAFGESSSDVRVSVRFDLVDVAQRAILFSDTLSTTEPAASRDPYAGVVAANTAVQRVLDQLVTALRTAVSTVSQKGNPPSAGFPATPEE